MRFRVDLQFFGGRGASSSGGGGGTGGISGADIVSTTSLISEREGKQLEVDSTLKVLKDIQDRYGVDVEDVQIAALRGNGARAMAYYDSEGNLAVNKNYFDSAKMDSAYDRCVDAGFHPSRGNKTALEAVVAHEMGHRLTDRAGGGWNKLDSTADKIIQDASSKLRYKNKNNFMAKISGYAKENSAEAVAEAFADVYCNGNKASKESRAVVTELNKYFGGR